ncbi:hypothetical protein [Coxiella burnetii]|uniref:Uncharacterized protein n=1 Tax=Coxiella burnetii (strain RSA 493 / Nine Mile phase I) TaxID=227377 RepID=Q83E53_COXBU|nr:hypothetical protein [Coxiella burnetii]NP_819513.1 hypothetical protein CBU_0478 [Coxiella burnetii RSA 493]AAO90027.1 hypothetical protein CBU_0478 [Coxiella burnetii RSA 493]ACJ18830.1 hypothetical protein CbuG_1536 [Coxiella burnetii CbuG_Q212]ACJ20559.1 hypothetical protein CbuK_1383 [Coxiella burnetii CbuK_Q154]AML49591.1 hypothetical protein AUR58_10785 [Coxiella burnetii]AML55497.1 hypothetical protein AYM38_09770 [Coxiella burnetii]
MGGLRKSYKNLLCRSSSDLNRQKAPPDMNAGM